MAPEEREGPQDMGNWSVPSPAGAYMSLRVGAQMGGHGDCSTRVLMRNRVACGWRAFRF